MAKMEGTIVWGGIGGYAKATTGIHSSIPFYQPASAGLEGLGLRLRGQPFELREA